jgi:hypothetical protein
LRQPVEAAVGVARRALMGPSRARPSRDWHLARLWLGPSGGGSCMIIARMLARLVVIRIGSTWTAHRKPVWSFNSLQSLFR